VGAASGIALRTALRTAQRDCTDSRIIRIVEQDGHSAHGTIMTISSVSELEGLRRVGRVVAEALASMRSAVKPGISTEALDAIGERVARAVGARSAPQLTYDFPGFNCISVNEEIVHGIPGQRVIRAGDVVKLDVTLELDGFIADSAATVLVPPVALDVRRLQRCARSAFNRAMDAARAGARLRDIGRAVEREARSEGFHVLRELTGHGVGRGLHEEPTVPNYPELEGDRELWDGLVIAVEPMLCLREARVITERDGWTLRTSNRCAAVHHEHTIVIRRGAPEILTAAA
jgi:methionyl aminopeptidase